MEAVVNAVVKVIADAVAGVKGVVNAVTETVVDAVVAVDAVVDAVADALRQKKQSNFVLFLLFQQMSTLPF